MATDADGWEPIADNVGWEPIEPPKKQLSSAGPTLNQALGRGFVQGGTLGFGDEIGGAVQGGLQGLANLAPNGWLSGLGIENRYGNTPASETYKAGRNDERAANKAAEKAHGGAYLAGNLAGGLVTAPLMPGGQGATLLKLATTGAGLGAVQGLGNSESDTIAGDVGNTVLGGVLGAGAGAAGYGTGRLLGRGAQWAGGKANAIEETMANAGAKEAATATQGAKGLSGRTATAAYKNIDRLRELGRLEGLTGDGAVAAQELAQEVGDKAEAGLIPDKAAKEAAAKLYQEAVSTEEQRAAQATADRVNGVNWKRRGIEQLKRYGAPALAATGYHMITGDHSPMGYIGALSLGSTVRPMVRALVKQAADPYAQKQLLRGLAATGGFGVEHLAPEAESMLVNAAQRFEPGVSSRFTQAMANMFEPTEEEKQRALAQAAREWVPVTTGD